MSPRTATVFRAVLSFCLIGLVSPVVHAQTRNETVITPRITSQTVPEHPMVQLPSDLPTYLTTINYPLLHGAYATWPYAVPISFTNGASMPSSPPYLSMRPVPVVTKALAPSFEPPAMSALITVIVPESADVFFQGMRIPQAGTVRRFSSPALNPTWSYSYDVKAMWLGADGRWTAQTQRLLVHSGDRLTVTFPTVAPTTTVPSHVGTGAAEMQPLHVLPRGTSIYFDR